MHNFFILYPPTALASRYCRFAYIYWIEVKRKVREIYIYSHVYVYAQNKLQ